MINKEEIEKMISEKIQSAGEKYGQEVKFLLIETLSLEKMLRPDIVPQTRLIPVPKWELEHSYPTVKALRMLIFKAETNGFNTVIVRKGKRVFIDEQKFFKWLEGKEEKKLA